MHCWKGKQEWIEDTYGYMSKEHVDSIVNDDDGTCMLEDGHEGDHEWTPDDDIFFTFVGEAPS